MTFMKRRSRIFAAATAVSLAFLCYALSAQQRGPAAGAPAGAPAAPRGGAPALPGAPAPQGARGAVLPGTESGWSTFQTRCASCHLNPAVDLATPGTVLRTMTPEKIYATLTTGSMKEQSQGINDGQKQRIAEFLAGRPMGSSPAGDAKNMPNKCPSNPPMTDPAASASWNGWGNTDSNTRFQTAAAARLTADDVPKLKLKWAFGFPKGETTSSQPAIVSGRVFVASDNGYIYSLDAATGCVYWSFEGGSIVRGAVTVGPVTAGGARYAVFYGDGHANIYAVNAQNGKMLWKTKVDSHIVARITAGTRFYNGNLYVPVSSSEEFSSGTPDYPCCSSRGSLVKLDANTGRIVWKTWVVPGEMKPYKIQSNGVVLYAPGGGGVWNAPTIDTVRQVVYISTGDATTFPSPVTTDGVIAVDIATGKVVWSYQADEKDVFMGGCNGAVKSEACPNPMGPDLDIGNSPILKALPGGKRVLIVGTKRGHVIALDPDNKGAVVYRVLSTTGAPPPAAAADAPRGGAGRGGGGGSIVWGGAADDQYVYYGSGDLVAMKLATGERGWAFKPSTGSLGAAPTVIPGVVFEGSSNGQLYAVSTSTGMPLWNYDTSKAVETVNKVPAHGGAISVSGASIAGGMVFVSSGYAITSSTSGGNVMLAFSPQ